MTTELSGLDGPTNKKTSGNEILPASKISGQLKSLNHQNLVTGN